MTSKQSVIEMRRAALLGARIRFSPTGVSIREQSIHRIIEQNLATIEKGIGLSEKQLRNLITLEDKVPVLRVSDVKKGINYLKSVGRIKEYYEGSKVLYMLSDTAFDESKQILAKTENQLNTLIDDLFGCASGDPYIYKKAFLHFLCLFFSQLTDYHIQVITMRKSYNYISESQLFNITINKVVISENVNDEEAFRYGIRRFFEESFPLYDNFKWNMAQNYYVIKALGVDDASDLLSIDIFLNSTFYCDTNILIDGIFKESPDHYSIIELINICKRLKINLKATRITIDELRNVISTVGKELRILYKMIPKETQKKIDNFLLKEYISEKEENPDLELDKFLEKYKDITTNLQEKLEIEIEDNKYFQQVLYNDNTTFLAEQLSRKFEFLRKRRKSESAAVHDAIMLQWIDNENKKGNVSWLVTLDVSLARYKKKEQRYSSHVINLNALLQWISPFCGESSIENRLSEIFSAAMKYQILPKETFIDLRDFQVFSEMGIETGQLPAEDVEGCIRELKAIVPQIDLRRAIDREKISRIFERYFADPGRKYQQEMQKLRSERDELKNELAKEKDKKDELEQLIERRKKERKIIKSIAIKMVACTLTFIIVESIIIYYILTYSEGANWLQKLTNSWQWISMIFAGFVGSIYIILGKEGRNYLKWWERDKTQ